jgi:hypothetical protein
LLSLTTLLYMVLSRDECDRDHGMRRRFLVIAAASLPMPLKLSTGVRRWCALTVGRIDLSGACQLSFDAGRK